MIVLILFRFELKGNLAIISYDDLISSYLLPDNSNSFNIAISVFEPFGSGRKSAVELTAHVYLNNSIN
jgi:hypothetical protein